MLPPRLPEELKLGNRKDDKQRVFCFLMFDSLRLLHGSFSSVPDSALFFSRC